MQVAILNSTDDGPGPSAVSLQWHPYLSRELGKVHVGRVKRISSFDLSPDRNLEQFRRRKIAALQLRIQTVGKVDLNSWHTPNCTSIDPTGQWADPRYFNPVERVGQGSPSRSTVGRQHFEPDSCSQGLLPEPTKSRTNPRSVRER